MQSLLPSPLRCFGIVRGTPAFFRCSFALTPFIGWANCRLTARRSLILYDTLPEPLVCDSTSTCGNHESYAVFHISWTKSIKTGGADRALVRNGGLSSPVTVLQHHLSSKSAIPHHVSLFSFETDDGFRASFFERCNTVWKEPGLEALIGCCSRFGEATELLLRGTHPDIVAKLEN